MTSEEYIRKAVWLAEHWWGAGTDAYGPGDFHRPYESLEHDSPDTRFLLDALATQLWRQLLAQGFDVEIDIQGSTFEAPGMWVRITDMVYSNTERFEKDARENHSMNLIEVFIDFHQGRETTGDTGS